MSTFRRNVPVLLLACLLLVLVQLIRMNLVFSTVSQAKLSMNDYSFSQSAVLAETDKVESLQKSYLILYSAQSIGGIEQRLNGTGKSSYSF